MNPVILTDRIWAQAGREVWFVLLRPLRELVGGITRQEFMDLTWSRFQQRDWESGSMIRRAANHEHR